MAAVSTRQRQNSTASESPWQLAITRVYKNPTAMVGFITLLFLIAVAIAAPLLAPYDPIKQNPMMSLRPPSSEHWLGTD